MDRSERTGAAVERRHGSVSERTDRLDEGSSQEKYQIAITKIFCVRRVSCVRGSASKRYNGEGRPFIPRAFIREGATYKSER